MQPGMNTPMHCARCGRCKRHRENENDGSGMTSVKSKVSGLPSALSASGAGHFVRLFADCLLLLWRLGAVPLDGVTTPAIQGPPNLIHSRKRARGRGRGRRAPPTAPRLLSGQPAPWPRPETVDRWSECRGAVRCFFFLWCERLIVGGAAVSAYRTARPVRTSLGSSASTW